MEDAWAALPDVPFLGRPSAAFGVFDGVGNYMRGQEAAWAAASALPQAVLAARSPEDVLASLGEIVIGLGGMTTAAIVVDGGDGSLHLLSAGDSSAYVLDGTAARQVLPLDVDASGHLTGCLGLDPPQGRARTAPLASGASVLLCTDGVDHVVDAPHLVAALGAPRDALEPAARRLLDEVLARGAPDNAAIVLARRR